MGCGSGEPCRRARRSIGPIAPAPRAAIGSGIVGSVARAEVATSETSAKVTTCRDTLVGGKVTLGPSATSTLLQLYQLLVAPR